MSKLWDAVSKVGLGALYAAENRHYEKPEVQKKMHRKAMDKARKCTPCASAAYVDQLHKTFGG